MPRPTVGCGTSRAEVPPQRTVRSDAAAADGAPEAPQAGTPPSHCHAAQHASKTVPKLGQRATMRAG